MDCLGVKSFSDLAGHERYLKTTLYGEIPSQRDVFSLGPTKMRGTGLTSGSPSLVLLMVAANAGLIGMSKEHLAIALALSVPVAVCITKVTTKSSSFLNRHD